MTGDIMSKAIAAQLQQRRFDMMPPRMRTAMLPCPADMPMPEYIPDLDWTELDRLHAEAKQAREEANYNTNEYRKGRW